MRPDTSSPGLTGSRWSRGARTGPRPGGGGSSSELLDDESVLSLLRFGVRVAASRLGVSERTFRRRFELHGLRLGACLRARRRELTLRKLEGDHPLSSVALELGFGSPQSFARYVRREFGTTATNLRRAIQSGRFGDDPRKVRA